MKNKEIFAKYGYVVVSRLLKSPNREFLIDKHWETAPPRFDPTNLATLSYFTESETIQQSTPAEKEHGGLVRDQNLWRSHKYTTQPDMLSAVAPIREAAEKILERPITDILFRGIYAILPEERTKKATDVLVGGHIDTQKFDMGATIYLEDVPIDGGGFTVYPDDFKVWTREEFVNNKEELKKYFILAEPFEIPGEAGDVIFWHPELSHVSPYNYVPYTYRPAAILDLIGEK